jgi:hypothetical protein
MSNISLPAWISSATIWSLLGYLYFFNFAVLISRNVKETRALSCHVFSSTTAVQEIQSCFKTDGEHGKLRIFLMTYANTLSCVQIQLAVIFLFIQHCLEEFFRVMNISWIFSCLQHVMKFANIIKEMQVLHQSSAVKYTGLRVGRRKANQVNHCVINFNENWLRLVV